MEGGGSTGDGTRHDMDISSVAAAPQDPMLPWDIKLLPFAREGDTPASSRSGPTLMSREVRSILGVIDNGHNQSLNVTCARSNIAIRVGVDRSNLSISYTKCAPGELFPSRCPPEIGVMAGDLPLTIAFLRCLAGWVHRWPQATRVILKNMCLLIHGAATRRNNAVIARERARGDAAPT